MEGKKRQREQGEQFWLRGNVNMLAGLGKRRVCLEGMCAGCRAEVMVVREPWTREGGDAVNDQ